MNACCRSGVKQAVISSHFSFFSCQQPHLTGSARRFIYSGARGFGRPFFVPATRQEAQQWR